MKADDMQHQSVTRREFARKFTAGTSLALGSLAAVSGEAQAIDDTPQDQQPALEPEDFLLAAILQQYPVDHLTDGMLVGIRADLRRHRRQGEQLRSAALGNSDEPATLFRAWRRE